MLNDPELTAGGMLQGKAMSGKVTQKDAAQQAAIARFYSKMEYYKALGDRHDKGY